MDNTVNVSRSQSGRGSSGFAVGFGVQYQKDMAFNEYAREVYQEGAQALFKEQLGVAQTYLNTRTGELQRHLASEPFSISTGQGYAMLNLMYQLKVRFLDLKKTKRGKQKGVYEPIYNRLVWGFVFGRIYKQLRYGFTQDVRNRYVGKLREIYKQPI